LNYDDSESSTGVEMKSPMGPGHEMIVPGDLEGSYNEVTSMYSVEGKTYRSLWDS